MILTEQLYRNKDKKLLYHGSSEKNLKELLPMGSELSGYPCIYLTNSPEYALNYAAQKQTIGNVVENIIGSVYAVTLDGEAPPNIYNGKHSPDRLRLKNQIGNLADELVEKDWWLEVGKEERDRVLFILHRRLKFEGFFNWEADDNYPSIGIFCREICTIRKEFNFDELSKFNLKVQKALNREKSILNRIYPSIKDEPNMVKKLNYLASNCDYFTRNQILNMIDDFNTENHLVESFLELMNKPAYRKRIFGK